MNTFQTNLIRLRKESGLTQHELASKLGITRSRLSNYEHGTREPDFEVLEIIADFFHVDFDELVGHEAPQGTGISADERRLISVWRLAKDKNGYDENVLDEMIMQLASRLDRDQILELSKKLIDVAARK